MKLFSFFVFFFVLFFQHSVWTLEIDWNRAVPFQYGVDNHVYLLETVVAKVYTKKTEQEVQRIIQNTEMFIKNGFLFPKILALIPHNDHPCVIMEYKHGHHPLQPTHPQLQAIGAIMARFHLQQINPSCLPSCHPFDDMESFFAKCTSFLHNKILESWYIEHAIYNFLNIPELFYGPLHGDFSPTNVLMQDDVISAILDPDHMSYGPAIVDLARSFIFFCFDADGKFLPENKTALLMGYESIRVLNEQEKKVIDPLFLGLLSRMISETYYHVNVLKDVSMDIFTGYRASQTPDQLFLRWFNACQAPSSAY